MALTTERQVSEETYRRLALGNSQLELHRGQLREKPGMSVEHGHVMDDLLGAALRATRSRSLSPANAACTPTRIVG